MNKKEMKLHIALQKEEAKNRWNKRFLFIALIIWGMGFAIAISFWVIAINILLIGATTVYMIVSIRKMKQLIYDIKVSGG